MSEEASRLDAILDDEVFDTELRRETSIGVARCSDSNNVEAKERDDLSLLNCGEIQASSLIDLDEAGPLTDDLSVSKGLNERLTLAKAHLHRLEKQLSTQKEQHQASKQSHNSDVLSRIPVNSNLASLRSVQRFVEQLFNNGLVDTGGLERMQKRGKCGWMLLKWQEGKREKGRQRGEETQQESGERETVSLNITREVKVTNGESEEKEEKQQERREKRVVKQLEEKRGDGSEREEKKLQDRPEDVAELRQNQEHHEQHVLRIQSEKYSMEEFVGRQHNSQSRRSEQHREDGELLPEEAVFAPKAKRVKQD